jgi:carboxyl-terminal processing protease
VIQPAVYPQANQIETLLPELQVRHDTRTADHPEFNYLRSLSERARENGRRTHLSLNESTRTAEKEAEDAWRLGLENELRVAKGDEPVESLDALEELLTAEEEAAEEEEIEEDPADDPLIAESGKILLDFIGLTHQVALVERLPEEAETTIQ